MKPLYKTTVTFWTEWNPANYEVEDLIDESTGGHAYISSVDNVQVADPSLDPAWDDNNFFDEVYWRN